jgi:hypothetical protein
MTMRTQKLWLLTMSLVIGALLMCGCQKTTYYVTASPNQPGKVVLNPRQNDVIQWAGVTPNFLGPSPCSADPSNGTCTVNVSEGSYLYSCAGCVDPEVVVGPGSGSKLSPPQAHATTAVSESVSLWCNNNQVSLAPPAVPFTAHAGDSLEVVWVNTGSGNQKINDPAVTPSTPVPVPCMETQIGPPPNNYCTFTAPATTTTFNYTAKSAGGACGGTSASGTIVVTIQ